MGKKELGATLGLQPVPVVLVSSADTNGRANIITLAWVGVACSTPPMVTIAVRPGRFSYQLIRDSQEFVINIPSADQIAAAVYCGSHSGRKEDKFAGSGLTSVPASKVKAPLVAECPVNMECIVRHTLSLGSHTLFVGEIVATHADENVLDSAGKMAMDKVNPLAYSAASQYWSLGEQLHYKP